MESLIMKNNTRKLVGIGGAVVVLIGLFCPLFSVPFFGNVFTYAAQAQGEGVLLGLAAIIAGVVMFASETAWPSVVAGLIVFADVGLTLGNYAARIGNLANSDNPFAAALSHAVSPTYGFAVLILGGAGMIASAFLASSNAEPEENYSKTDDRNWFEAAEENAKH
jgi:hypothetical protein